MPTKPPSVTIRPETEQRRAADAARLARALRSNLARRKEQNRARDAAAPGNADADEAAGGET